MQGNLIILKKLIDGLDSQAVPRILVVLAGGIVTMLTITLAAVELCLSLICTGLFNRIDIFDFV